MLKWILGFVAGIKIIDLLQGAKDKISFEFLRPKRGDVDLVREKMKLRIRVTNNNPIGFPIDGVTGIVSHTGTVLGEVQSSQIHDIPARGSKELVTEINITSENILFQLAESILSKNWMEPLVFQGAVYIKDRRFPIQRRISLV